MSAENPKNPPKKKDGSKAAEAAQLAVAEKAATAKTESAKVTTEEAAQKEYEEAAKAVAEAKAAGASFTDKHGQERIFRREMGEPEFFHYKKDLIPPRPVLTEEEQEEISRKVEIATDQTPPYKPEHILSSEFGGISNYESGISDLVEETKQKLDRLKNDPYTIAGDITRTEQDLKYLDSLYENFYFGMNVFRTAKGGRGKLRE